MDARVESKEVVCEIKMTLTIQEARRLKKLMESQSVPATDYGLWRKLWLVFDDCLIALTGDEEEQRKINGRA